MFNPVEEDLEALGVRSTLLCPQLAQNCDNRMFMGGGGYR